jgi:hypothetical protein
VGISQLIGMPNAVIIGHDMCAPGDILADPQLPTPLVARKP